MTTHTTKVSRVGGNCACGCGTIVPQPAGAGRPRKWIEGHKPGKTKDRLCACGCGANVVRFGPRGALPKYLAGHAPVKPRKPRKTNNVVAVEAVVEGVPSTADEGDAVHDTSAFSDPTNASFGS